MPGSALGDAVGISWLLREVDGVKVVAHGGTTIGQHSEFLMVPEHGFGLISMTNCGPNGPKFNDQLRIWAFEQYLGVIEREPVPVQLGADELEQYVGQYETIIVLVDVEAADGGLVAKISVKPEMRETLREAGQDPDEPQPDFPIGLLEGAGDKYVITTGAAEGMKGYFTRNADGAVDGIHLGGRLATRVAAPQPA